MSDSDPNSMDRGMQRLLDQLRQILNQNHESQIISLLKWFVETLFENDSNSTRLKEMSGDLAGLIYKNLVSFLDATATSGGQAKGQASINAASMSRGNVQQFQNQDQQFPQGLYDMNAVMRSHAVAPEGSFFDLHGSNQGGSNLTPVESPLAEQVQMSNQQLQQYPQQFQSPRIVQGTAAGDVMRVPTPRQNVPSSSTPPLMAQLTTRSPKVVCCDFSSEKELFATGGCEELFAIGGCDNNVELWSTKSFSLKYTLEEHNAMITDVRFCPTTFVLATSSRDRTVRIWDVDFTRNSLLTLPHAKEVMSLDFHRDNSNLICTCDTDQIILWDLQNNKNLSCKVRFQPGLGKYLAVARTDHISLIDLETQRGEIKLQGHKEPVRYVCWDDVGVFLASVSGDMVKIWKREECIGEFKARGKSSFYSCVFHPFCSYVVIASNQTIELWNFSKQGVNTTIHAHNDVISSLAISSSGLVASASGKHVKFWNFDINL